MKLIEFDPEARIYCTIAAAIIGAGALGAGASIWGADKAANAQQQSSQASIANTRQTTDAILGQNREIYDANRNLLSPFINAGVGGIGQLQDWISPTGGSTGSNALSSLIKLVTPGADMSATLAQTPGFQFAQGQGTRQALNALAARGLGGSPGAIAKGVSNYNSGLASQTRDSLVQNLLSTFGAGTNALSGLVNTGVNAGGLVTGAGNSLMGANTGAMTAGMNSVNSAITGAGNAQAAGYNAMGSAAGGLGNSLATASLINSLTGSGTNNSVYGNPNNTNGVFGLGEYS